VCGQLGILYVGAFSAAPVMVALGLYFFCRTESTASAIAIYAIAAGAHAVEACLVITGALRDPGFYPVGHHASIPAQIAGQLCLQVAYSLCFWLARATRRTSLDAIAGLQRATRIAAQREVQLAELRRDLARAREVGAPGRFTDHTVGSWQLGNVLGCGAMARVYEAAHRRARPPRSSAAPRAPVRAAPRRALSREVRSRRDRLAARGPRPRGRDPADGLPTSRRGGCAAARSASCCATRT
jgi:hypothetical protein